MHKAGLIPIAMWYKDIIAAMELMSNRIIGQIPIVPIGIIILPLAIQIHGPENQGG
jgi:hypothetical protein